MDWKRRSWDGGDVDVADPFLCHQRPLVLSVQDSVVRLLIPKQLYIHAWWITLNARYRSLLATWPSGLPQETIWAIMSAIKYAHHRMGCSPESSVDVAAALGFC